MKIYAQEKLDDLEDLILSTPLISMSSQVYPASQEGSSILDKNIKSLASYSDEDLYYVQSVLVTSTWNKNDDIFTKEEIWAAKKTPEDKPTNLEHDENTIIGHIVSNWSITDDGILIDEDTPVENLPEKFHIVTGSVIYKSYSSPELRDRTNKLISEIENGTKYVSMECIFKGFDYGLINQETGEYKVLSRSDETSFLTKHLRAYGGSGKYENHKIGRVLRNITFSGKGYVDKPANPDSIIFNKENFESVSNKKSTNKSFSGVSENRPNTTEVNNMNLEKEVAELKEKVEAMNDCASANKEAYSQIIELKDKIAAMEIELKNKSEQLDEINSQKLELAEQIEAAKKEKEEEMMKKEEEMKKSKSELEAALETVSAYKEKEMEMMKKEKKMKRVASLVEGGVDQNLAASTVDKFESLEDEAFQSIVDFVMSTLSSSKSAVTEETKEETKASVENINEDVLENAEPENDIGLSVGSDSSIADDAINSTRAALVDFVCARLGKKLNKGE
jgi:hypothetical protein